MITLHSAHYLTDYILIAIHAKADVQRGIISRDTYNRYTVDFSINAI